MSNYNRDKQGKLTQAYEGEPKVRINVSLTQTCLDGLDQLICETGSKSRSELIEKIGRGEIKIDSKGFTEDEAVINEVTNYTPSLFPTSEETQLLEEIKAKLSEAYTVTHNKQKGATAKAKEIIDYLVQDLLKLK